MGFARAHGIRGAQVTGSLQLCCNSSPLNAPSCRPRRRVLCPQVYVLMEEFPGQTAVDAIILAGSTIFTLVSIAYIASLWSMRRNFTVLLR